METITTYDKQSVFDLALQAYGSIEGAFDIVKDNASLLPTVTSEATAGKKIKVNGLPISKDVIDYYQKNQINPVSFTPEVADAASTFSSEFSEEFI